MLSGSSLEGLELLEEGPFQLGDPYTRLPVDIVGFFDAWSLQRLSLGYMNQDSTDAMAKYLPTTTTLRDLTISDGQPSTLRQNGSMYYVEVRCDDRFVRVRYCRHIPLDVSWSPRFETYCTRNKEIPKLLSFPHVFGNRNLRETSKRTCFSFRASLLRRSKCNVQLQMQSWSGCSVLLMMRLDRRLQVSSVTSGDVQIVLRVKHRQEQVVHCK
jgi:hypothetical protein